LDDTRSPKNRALCSIKINHKTTQPMTKATLIAKITTAFQAVKLENGVGLWEAQGIDDYADEQKLAELRSKDERDNWDNIPNQDLVRCQSSLSFFDAKGMRFCLPKFLISDLLDPRNSPDVTFTLGYKLNETYQKNRFSLLDKPQIQSVIDYLESKLSPNYADVELEQTIGEWKLMLLEDRS
jgi:hypothetical protein